MKFPFSALLLSILVSTVFGTLTTSAMEFSHVSNGGNCGGCEWIVAKGVVQSGDAERFEKLLKQEYYTINPSPDHNIIMFDSVGGSLAAGMKLGKKIRELGFTVSIGKSDPIPDSTYFELSPGNCISACAYAFLGGKYRILDDDNSCLGFHQFFDNSAVERSHSDISVSVQETTQIISGIIVQYLTQISASLEIYTFASKYTGKEFGCLNRNERLKTKVDNSVFQYSTATILPFGKGLVAEIQSLQDGRSMRFYCMDGKKAMLAFFFPGDESVDRNLDTKREAKYYKNLKFTAYNVESKKQVFSDINLELAHPINNGEKTAYVFSIDRKFTNKAFEFGLISLWKEDAGRAEQGLLDSYSFVISGSRKIPKLLKNNCIN